MSWTEITSLALNLIFGGKIFIDFITLKSTKKDAAAKAESSNAQAGKDNVGLVGETVTTMVATVNQLMVQNKELIDKYVQKSEELEKVQKEKTDLESRFYDLEKRVNKMITTNQKVIKALESMGVDEEVIKQLRDNKQ